MRNELDRHKEAIELAVNHLAAQVTLGHLTGSAITAAKEVGFQINTILNPPPEMEMVEVVKYGVVDPANLRGDGLQLGATLYDQRDASFERLVSQYPGRQAVEVRYTVQRPKPQPVERSITVSASILSDGRICTDVFELMRPSHDNDPDPRDKSGALTFTWIEPV